MLGDLDVAIEGDLSTVQLPDEGFDVVYNSFVLEHVRDADRVLGNFARWLRPGGLMILRFPDRRSVRGFLTRVSPHWLHVLYYTLVLRYPNAGKPGFPPYPTVYHPTVSRRGIRRFCRANGMRLTEEWGDGQHLLWGNRAAALLTMAVLRAVAVLSLGTLTARHTNLIYVLHKEPEARRPLRLAAVLDTTAVGGAEVQLLELFRHLYPDAVTPRLVCLREGGPMEGEFRAAGFAVDVLHRRGRFDLRTLPRLGRTLRRSGADAVLVLHFHRASLVLGRLAAILTGVPHVVAVRDMGLRAVGRRCLPRHVVSTLFLTDALFLQAPSQGRYLHEQEGVGRRPWQRAPEVVIPNGIAVPGLPTPDDRRRARADLGLADDAVVLGIVGRLTAQKAHEVLVEAFRLALADDPRLVLVVVGGGPREPALRALVARSGLTDRVVLTGQRRDVGSLWPAFDIACLSSVHEGTPMTLIEAMAAGLPVVSTDCGAIRDMVTDEEEGFLVPVGDVAGLAERIRRLAADPELRAEQGARGRKRVERDHRVENTAAGVQRLLARIVAD